MIFFFNLIGFSLRSSSDNCEIETVFCSFFAKEPCIISFFVPVPFILLLAVATQIS